MPQTGGPIPVPKPKVPTQPPPRQNAPAVKVYVKPAARQNIQATKAVRFINQEVGSKVVKLTAKKSKAQITIKRGPNEGGGGYTYGQPKNARQVLKGPATRIRVDTSKGSQSAAGFEGSPPERVRTSTKSFQRTGKLGSNLTRDKNFSPTVAQTTAHEITHALGLTHRMGYKVTDGKYRKKVPSKRPGKHIMDWSASHYGEGEVNTILRKTNPKNIKKKRRK